MGIMGRKNLRDFFTSQKCQIGPRQTVMALLSNWSVVNSIWVIALRRDETLMLPLPAGCNGSIRQALLPLSLQREINPLPVVQPCKHIVPDLVTFVVKHNPFMHAASCSILHQKSSQVTGLH